MMTQPLAIEKTESSKMELPILTEFVVDCKSQCNKKRVDRYEENKLAIKTLLIKMPELKKYFHIHDKIGEGTFSNVYLATLKEVPFEKRFAIKHLIPTSHPRRIKSELECLTQIGGVDNVVSCDMSLRRDDCVVFIMPYLKHQKFGDYVSEMDVEEAKLYMKNLLLALKRVHSFNVIHRDVKPSNFLYNRKSRKFLLVDFGLAEKVDDIKRTKSLFPPKPVSKRKREDDDLENADRPAVKRLALQTLPNDITNKQVMKKSLGLLKQPLSEYPRRNQQGPFIILKRIPLTTNASNIMESGEKVSQSTIEFQSLLPQKLPVESGASFVRVQNSQVQSGLFPRPTAPVRRKDCDCNGKPQVCNACLVRKAKHAPRAGTPGFRPPEVLLKYPYQTTAVDMWAAGVIMLSIVSGCYPFFRSPDDITALSEFITVFGSTAIFSLAKKLGRNIICGEKRKPIDLMILCENFRQRKLRGEKTGSLDKLPMCKDCCHSENLDYGCLCESKTKLDLSNTHYPRSAYDLLRKLLDVDPYTRISAAHALEHEFFADTV